MACGRYRLIQVEALGGAAPSADVEAHRLACADCARAWRRDAHVLAGIERCLVEASEAVPSPDFLARVRGRLAEERSPAAIGWPQRLALAASLAAAMLAGLMLSRRTRPPSHPRPAVSLARDPGPALSAPEVASEARSAPERARTRPRTARRAGTRDAAFPVEVRVERGQADALARMARGSGRVPAVRFAMGSLSAAALPELQVVDLPRFAPAAPRSMPAPWEGLTPEDGDAVFDGHEGSGS